MDKWCATSYTGCTMNSSKARSITGVAARTLQPRRMIFISGRISLDLSHTGGVRTEEAKAFEQLHEPQDFALWLSHSSLSLDVAPVSRHDLTAVYELRDAIWYAAHAVQSGVPVDGSDRDIINKYAARAPIIPSIDQCDTLVWARPMTVAAILSYIARDAIDLLGSETKHKLRECANSTCPLLFVDSSRPGKRRWCSMERCGSITKTARFRNKIQSSSVS